MKGAVLRPLLPLLGALSLLALWQICTSLRLIDPFLLPGPVTMLQSLVDSLRAGPLLHDFLATIGRTLLSLLIALLIAVPLGILLGSSEKLYRAVEFIVDFFRSTPATAVFPLFLVFFGVGDSTKIAVAAFGASLVILFNTAYGVMNTRKTRLLAARVMGASRLRVLVDVTLWESLPQTFIGIRSGVSLALVIVIVAEMFIGSRDGLGHSILDSQMLFEMPKMYAAIFLSGALGYGLNAVFLMIERRFIHWGGK